MIAVRMEDGQLNRMATAKAAVADYLDMETTDDLFVVWFCKTLFNWKALISTDALSGVYFEVTYDGNRNKIYLDYYKKADNKAIRLED